MGHQKACQKSRKHTKLDKFEAVIKSAATAASRKAKSREPSSSPTSSASRAAFRCSPADRSPGFGLPGGCVSSRLGHGQLSAGQTDPDAHFQASKPPDSKPPDPSHLKVELPNPQNAGKFKLFLVFYIIRGGCASSRLISSSPNSKNCQNL